MGIITFWMFAFASKLNHEKQMVRMLVPVLLLLMLLRLLLLLLVLLLPLSLLLVVLVFVLLVVLLLLVVLVMAMLVLTPTMAAMTMKNPIESMTLCQVDNPDNHIPGCKVLLLTTDCTQCNESIKKT